MKRVIGTNLDFSFGFHEDNLRPYVEIGEIKNGGKAYGAGSKIHYKLRSFEYDTQVGMVREQDNFIRHYFDERFHAVLRLVANPIRWVRN